MYNIHLVSDSTGDTVKSLTKACLAQFDGVDIKEHFYNLVSNERQLQSACQEISEAPGLVIFTLVSEELRNKLEEFCLNKKLPYIPVLDPLLNAFSGFLGSPMRAMPGGQHLLDEEYFTRIDAIDFALSSDDGQASWKLKDADVILVGVSRTSKTPTCLYLANRGIKAANIPYVPGQALPAFLFDLQNIPIIGLTEDAERLIQVRLNRLKTMNQKEETTYVDPEHVRREVIEARRFFTDKGWPVIDVTKRSIEETAAEIIRMLQRRAHQSPAPQQG
ncbi:MAG: pyruvate, water dikinase regulatory protein [Alphaproteobacteria bacterium]